MAISHALLFGGFSFTSTLAKSNQIEMVAINPHIQLPEESSSPEC
jgi:hypothetical protein